MIRLHKLNKIAFVCIAVILASLPVFAQVAEQTTAAPVIMAPANETVIRSGTEVILKLREELTTKKKKLKVGYRFQMEVAEPIRLNNKIIIPSGTPPLVK